MTKRFSNGALALAIAAASAQLVAEELNKPAETSLEQVVIIGSQQDAKAVAGSAFVVDAEELAKFEYSDINRILRQVPGVYVQQEEGYGLRPNIRIRSAVGGRSEKINLMEDGVLIAPAPYSGPSAYYFPTAGRMSAVEILKGPETLQYGPYTVGGAVNLISTPIPDQAAGLVHVEVGEDGEDRIHAWYGDSQQNYGWMVETYQHDAQGFKDIDRSNRSTGFNKEDYLAKLRVNTDEDSAYYNQLDIKLQYSTEVSDQSYLGLTDADFDRDPNRRYGISELDQMDNEHASINVSHLIALSDAVSVKTTAYYNDFERDWYKLDGAGSYIDEANDGDALSQSLLDGTRDTAVGEYLKVKHNAREYKSAGLQSELNWTVEFLGTVNDLDFGVRWHEDEVDRFQPNDMFSQVNGSLVYEFSEDPSSSNNRLEEAKALSLYVMDHIAVTDRLDVTAGIRYEDIETEQVRYNDVERSSGSKTAENSTSETMLALGATYQISDAWGLLVGAHQGFAPAGAGSTDTDPEESINYEAGVRFTQGQLFAEAIYFFSDFKNAVTYCTVANPCGTATSGSESEGEAEIEGLELAVNYDFSAGEAYSIPLTFAYTYTQTEYTEGGTGSAQKGDVYAYVPENQWAASIGFVAAKGWDAYLNASYTDAMCINTTCERSGADNTFRETDDLLVLDASASYPLSDATRVYVKVDNLLDEQEIVSRSPDGARANKPRTAYVGLKVNF